MKYSSGEGCEANELWEDQPKALAATADVLLHDGCRRIFLKDQKSIKSAIPKTAVSENKHTTNDDADKYR